MPNVIVFDSIARSAIRGTSSKDARSVIEPILMTDGRYYVGVEILTDTKLDAKIDNVKALPIVDYTTIAAFIFKRTRP